MAWRDFAVADVTNTPTYAATILHRQFDEWIDIDSPCLALPNTKTYQEGGPLRMGHRVEALDETNSVSKMPRRRTRPGYGGSGVCACFVLSG